MQNDCEIYVDPEEDEVFFGCVSEREKTVSAKLINCGGSSLKDDCGLSEVSDRCHALNVDEENVGRLMRNKESSKVIEEIFLDDSTDLIEPFKECKESFENSQDSCSIHSNNTSVELDHNYSTPMKHKIDKSILATPKSVVKADKDGGFLKVLSEIALVKAEAEGDKKSEEKREDEDKENKLIYPIPEIKVTEATPEKNVVLSPPRTVNAEQRRFRIIYRSPQKEEKVGPKSKHHAESFESEKNHKNKCLDRGEEKEKGTSVDVIDFKDCARSIDLDVSFLVDTQPPNGKTRADESGEAPPDRARPRRPADILRFSKEARKIVEVLKKSSADDTLNFTVPEIDVEEEDNSFLSPEPVSSLDDPVVTNKPQPEKASPRILTKPPDNQMTSKPTPTTEKDRRNLTLVSSQSKLQPVKYFSDRRIYNQSKERCVKKLPSEEKRPTVTEKSNGTSAGGKSKIPVFGAKNSKIPLTERTARTPLAKTTSSKIPSVKSAKNFKFNHIESPISAYIHNKPTSLVVNVKSEGKKDGAVSRVWKSQSVQGGEKNFPEKKSESAVVLPFVEYKSATPYIIEKKPESRLPRLAPSVMKLIGAHSPKVLRHEGRFYLNTPRNGSSTENTTMVADPNEVSVIVSQPVQKSHTIK